jgi:hypothetical protein
MGRLSLFVLIGPMALAAPKPAAASAAGQTPIRLDPSAVVVQTQGENRREASGAPSSGKTTFGAKSPDRPLIGFIDSPSATCYQPDPSRDVCFLNWYYVSVDASPNYMISLWIFLNPNLVSYTGGFFQTSMYVPYNMLGQGFRVACGPPVVDNTDPMNPWTHGNQYAYTIRAKDSSNLKSANYGTATCPAFIPAP